MIQTPEFLKRPLPLIAAGASLIGIPVIAGSFVGSGMGALLVMGVTFLSLLFFSGLFLFVHKWYRRAKGNALSNFLRKDANSTKIEGIDSLRTNFELGVEKMRKAGKNVYDLPWFLLAGQTGAGKTEAIRRGHSKEDFPAGLNDYMQGVGGTLNMNWWFTNKAIILDTAGRIFEEKVKAGESTEWTEFLKMLKKARGNMPINGFILVIPADSLLTDTIDQIEGKASHIADQLTRVQDALGVRFPVFVIVSKADFIPGFREFVENIKEPRLQHQMLGWSNPKSLDDPFAPDQVDSYLDGVVERLKKRRLTYMLDPRPHTGKRLDDLDALFSFPNYLKQSVPNLRRYLEIVFKLNPWSVKPLFIRGIYFTSSLQQGEALDEAIAGVIGKNLQQMKLSQFKKETPLFLRDAFFEKIYREYGLVTAATKVKAAVRRRTALFSAVCVLAVSGILSAAWFGASSFRERIGDEYAYWQFAASQFESRPGNLGLFWTQPIVFDTGVGDLFESNQALIMNIPGVSHPSTLPESLYKLGGFAQQPLRIPSVFKPLRFFDRIITGDSLDREQAFRRIFEAAVVVPIIENSREKLRASNVATWDQDSVTGLRAQLRLQVLLNRSDRSDPYLVHFSRELSTLFRYLTGEELDFEIRELLDRFYGSEFRSATGWPSPAFSTFYAPALSLDDLRMVGAARGLEVWLQSMDSIRVQQSREIGDLIKLLESAESLLDLEQVFLQRSASAFDRSGLATLRSQWQTLQEVSGSNESFAIRERYNNRILNSKDQLDRLVREFSNDLSAGGVVNDPLVISVLDRVNRKQDQLIRELNNLVDERLLQRFDRVDAQVFSLADGIRPRLSRYNMLEQNLTAMDALRFSSLDTALSTLGSLNDLHEQTLSALQSYSGHQHRQLFGLAVHSDNMRKIQISGLVQDFTQELRHRFSLLLGFPVIAVHGKVLTAENIVQLVQQGRILYELSTSFAQQLPAQSAVDLNVLNSQAAKVIEFTSRHLDATTLVQVVTFVQPPVSEVLQLIRQRDGLSRDDALRSSIFWRARLVSFGAGEAVRMSNSAQRLGSIKLSESSISIDFKSVIDGQIGDSGSAVFEGAWLPLQLILDTRYGARHIDGGRYALPLEVGSQGFGNFQSFVYLDFPASFPRQNDWLRLRDIPLLSNPSNR